MRSLRITLLALLAGVAVANVNAQVYPWEKYGFDPKVVTLSKGKYEEFHDLKTVVEIGSILYNTETKQIVGFVAEDTLKENGLKPHIVSRWISPDPLAEEYTSWSPYNYAMNNPIKFIDPDGRFVDWYQSEAGNVTWREGSANTININGEQFSNIGKTYSSAMSGGGYVNYFQNIPIAITNSKVDAGQLLAHNDGLYRNAMSMASSRSMQSEMFMTRYNINNSEASGQVLMGTMAIPSAIIGGELLLTGGIFSTSFWGGKAAISAGTQAIMNKGDIDVFDVGADAFLTPGASALIGGAVDYNPFRSNSNFNYIGGNKSINQFGLDVGTGLLSSKISGKAFDGVSPYLKNETEKNIFNAVFSLPTSFLGGGINIAVKKNQNE